MNLPGLTALACLDTPEHSSKHGVFVPDGDRVTCYLQKPSPETQAKSGAINACPSFNGNSWGRPNSGYGYNANYIGGDLAAATPIPPTSLGNIAQPAETVLLADAAWGEPLNGTQYLRPPSDWLANYGKAHFRHNGTANVAYADGHAKASTQKFGATAPDIDCGFLSADDSAYDRN